MQQQQEQQFEHAGPAGLDFEFSADDFTRVCRLIHAHAGIHLAHNKRAMVYSRLGRRLRKLQYSSFKDYLDRIDGGDTAELGAFINALTTNLTYFYRETHHFEILREFVRNGGVPRDSTIWSAGGSTGEEAYSIAMVLASTASAPARVGQIVASDIDTSVLEHAERGIYPAEQLKHVPSAEMKRFFLGGTGENAGLVKVRPELKRLVAFRQINLHDSGWAVRTPVKAIFCRNVMIYFNANARRAILERFGALLEPGGLLFLGHAENVADMANLFRPLGRTAYMRIERRGTRVVEAHIRAGGADE